MGKYTVEYFIQTSLVFDATDYILPILGRILHTSDDASRTEVGMIEAYKLDVARAIQDDVDLYGMMAYNRDNVLDAISCIYTDDRLRGYRSSVEEILENYPGSAGNIIVITSVDICSVYQNRYIELAAIFRTIRTHYHGCDLAVLIADKLDRITLDYCMLLGFKKVPDTQYLVYPAKKQDVEAISLIGDMLPHIDPDL